jgi:hypothetical protein
MPAWIGQAAGCREMTAFNVLRNAAEDAARKPYVDLCQLDTPGYDYEERLEPKRGPIANRRNRPCDSILEALRRGCGYDPDEAMAA